MSDEFNLDDMLDSYLYENRQLIDQLQELVLAKKDASHFDQSTIHKIFRTMHTIKGNSGIMMFDSITKVSHKLEDVFAVIRESQPENVPHMELVEYVLEVSDFISIELNKIENAEEIDGDADSLVSKLDVLLEQIKSKNVGAVRETYVRNVPNQQFYIAPAANAEKPVIEEDSKPFIFIDLESSVEEIEARAERTQRQIMEESKTMNLVPGDFVIQTKETGWLRGSEKSKYIQVDTTKMDQLVDIVDALVRSQSEVINNPTNFQESVKKMQDLSVELQNMIESIRKVPLTNIFQRMNRIVFDASRKLGKDIELVMEGETTEVDKSVAEQIADPLMHLIRNAVDHGIESAQERKLAGKPARGKILLSAKADTEYIWIVVEDNGRGLNKEKIFNKALQQGVIDLDKTISDYSDKEIYGWIMLPGFSTRENVSEYSGRGVGLDVVASNLKALNGYIEIESEEGVGSRMILQIPRKKRD